MDDPLAGSGARIPRTQRQCPPSGRGSSNDDMDGSDYDNLMKKEPPRRTLSSELDSSLVIGESNWKTLDTVHKRCEVFDDSDSFMGDSFAGSSFASTQDSWVEGETDRATSQFTTLDDETADAKASPNARKATPRRSYSKQSKRMPKKVDPLSAITEDDNDSVES